MPLARKNQNVGGAEKRERGQNRLAAVGNFHVRRARHPERNVADDRLRIFTPGVVRGQNRKIRAFLGNLAKFPPPQARPLADRAEQDDQTARSVFAQVTKQPPQTDSVVRVVNYRERSVRKPHDLRAPCYAHVRK